MKLRLTIHNHQSGFTILEIMITTVMIAIIGGAATLFAGYVMQSYSFSFTENQNINQAQYAMTTLVREMRKARTGENGAWPILDAQDNSFAFFSDVTQDGRTDLVRYFINGSVLYKGVIQPTQAPSSYLPENEVLYTITNNVASTSAALFTYYNGNWPADTVNNPLSLDKRLMNTRYIEINLTIDTASGSAKTVQPFLLNSGVEIRSLKDNL